MITVEKTGADVRVTISKDSIPPRRLNALLDWLRLEEIVQRSRLTEADADHLADEMKSDWWKTNQHRFITPDER